MVDPKLVMLDEPMAGVNPALVQSLLEHVQRLRDEGRTVVFVEHDMDVVMSISDRVVCMAEGSRHRRRHARSRSSSNQAVIDAYLGQHATRARHDRGPRALPARGARPRRRATSPGVDILNGCSLEVHEGEIVGIIGPNGAGKSTLVKAVFGLVPCAAVGAPARRRHHGRARPTCSSAAGVGYVPQLHNVFPALTIDDNLRMGCFLRPHDFHERRDEIIGLLPRLG